MPEAPSASKDTNAPESPTIATAARVTTGAGAAGIGVLVAWLAGDISPEVATAISTGIVAAGLFVFHNGIHSIIRALWTGSNNMTDEG